MKKKFFILCISVFITLSSHANDSLCLKVNAKVISIDTFDIFYLVTVNDYTNNKRIRIFSEKRINAFCESASNLKIGESYVLWVQVVPTFPIISNLKLMTSDRIDIEYEGKLLLKKNEPIYTSHSICNTSYVSSIDCCLCK
ncbi:MAG TPA: hypothetical protein VF476_01915 [Chitinophagaceae bacterium]